MEEPNLTSTNHSLSLALINLSLVFRNRAVLNSINLSVRGGELFTVYGTNGAGKTMLTEILNRNISPTGGSILIDGIDWNHYDYKTWRNQIGYVSDSNVFFNDTLLYNLALSHHPNDKKEALRFCVQHGFSKYFEALPKSYLTIIGGTGVQLSAGLRQLISIARELIRRPAILFLDEPTCWLDANGKNFVMELLLKEKRKRMIVMTTSQGYIASQSDKVAILDNGTITYTGSPLDRIVSENLMSESSLNSYDQIARKV